MARQDFGTVARLLFFPGFEGLDFGELAPLDQSQRRNGRMQEPADVFDSPQQTDADETFLRFG